MSVLSLLTQRRQAAPCCLAALAGLLTALAVPAEAQSPPAIRPSSAANMGKVSQLNPYYWKIQPVGKSPVDRFRELLAMSPAEVNAFLATDSPAKRKLILAKIRQYRAMDPNERELHLKVTELTFYLLPLMHTPATNRMAQLAMIPVEDRQLVQRRLAAWDRLSPEAQSELLTNQAALRYFTGLPGAGASQASDALRGTAPALRAKLAGGRTQWRTLSEAERERTLSEFEEFFGLTSQEKQQALSTLSEPERRQIAQTLQVFNKLPAPLRLRCIRSLEKFAELSVAERQQFFENGERWRLMSPDQRQAWRNLVHTIASEPPVPFIRPPLPWRARPKLATNGARR